MAVFARRPKESGRKAGFHCNVFNKHLFAVQTSPYIGLHKPKPRSTFSGYFYLSSCSLFFHVLTKHFTHRMFVCASIATNFTVCTLYKPNEMIAMQYAPLLQYEF